MPRVTTAVLSLLLIFGLSASSGGQAGTSPSSPLPQDAGASGLYQDLLRLKTTARLLHTTAHPDDEDGGMMTMESRHFGATVELLTLNRGEGGQNKFGSALSDELGVLRTLELLAADRYYGVSQRFTHVVDFGFSKSADETFSKWGGHDAAVADMVRVIRTFRPDVLVSRFQGADRDGHGNHQASGVVTREAFRAAGDPKRFPEQIAAGLLPWQPKKFYFDNVRQNEDWTVRLDYGAYDPMLGMSYRQFALEGLAHQISQGLGGLRVAPGHLYTYYKLVDSVLPPPKDAHEENFFDGIDTTLPGLASRLGADEKKVPWLRSALVSLDKKADEAMHAFSVADPSPAGRPLLEGVRIAEDLIARVKADKSLSVPEREELLTHLETKREQFNRAAGEALGIALQVSVDPPEVSQSGFFRFEQTFQMAYPGQTFTLTAHLYNRGNQPITPKTLQLDLPPGWKSEVVKQELKPLGSNEEATTQFRVTVPDNAQYTRPYWYRTDQQTQTLYTIDEKLCSFRESQIKEGHTHCDGMALPPYPVAARATYQAGENGGDVESIAQVKSVDPMAGQLQHPLAVGPPLSVGLEPPLQVMNATAAKTTEVTVSLRNNVVGKAQGTLRLDVPQGWRVEPASLPVNFAADGESNEYKFNVTPSSLREQMYQLKAVLNYQGKDYAEGYTDVTRPDLGVFYYYRPATQTISAVDVKLPPKLKVGYIMGAGDDIPEVLREIGLDVETISAPELATGNLSRFNAIVVGIRAYDVRTDVREHNRRLLDYVNNGGTLIVQYNQGSDAFNSGHYTPYPATETRDRVTVEEAPVEILDPKNPIFTYPNPITARDFDNWVQERGLYFMGKWDEHYKPLLSSHDPGEQPMQGGLLESDYGKGKYIYCGYAFFRQLPAGVPGAIRLFVNLLSAGGGKVDHASDGTSH